MVQNGPKWSTQIDHKFNRMSFITRFNLVLVWSKLEKIKGEGEGSKQQEEGERGEEVVSEIVDDTKKKLKTSLVGSVKISLEQNLPRNCP